MPGESRTRRTIRSDGIACVSRPPQGRARFVPATLPESRESTIRSDKNLRGRTVVTFGTTNEKAMHVLIDRLVVRTTIITAPNHTKSFAMLHAGKADAVAIDDVLLAASPRAPTGDGRRARLPRCRRLSVLRAIRADVSQGRSGLCRRGGARVRAHGGNRAPLATPYALRGRLTTDKGDTEHPHERRAIGDVPATRSAGSGPHGRSEAAFLTDHTGR